MTKRVNLPPDLFSSEDIDLVNRATYQTAKHIRLRSKRKFLREDPEAWFLANVIAGEHYKKLKMPQSVLISEFENVYNGEDVASKVRSLMDLGKKTYIAFYEPSGLTETELEKEDGADDRDWYCHECGKYNFNFSPGRWCSHIPPPEKPVTRYEWIVWCGRCNCFHRKIVPVGGSVIERLMCPLEGRIAPIKETVTLWEGNDEIPESVPPGGEDISVEKSGGEQSSNNTNEELGQGNETDGRELHNGTEEVQLDGTEINQEKVDLEW